MPKTPIIVQRTTGYYVTTSDGGDFRDAAGKMWFTKPLARMYAAAIGGWYEQGQRGTIKDVVTGYTEDN